jgi:NAD(P)H-hydrate epimerase
MSTSSLTPPAYKPNMDAITFTRQQSRAIDAAAINEYGIPGMVLMENAGRGVVELLLQWDPALVDNGGSAVVIVCGKGNNAGDGFVIARHLEIHGARPRIVLLCPPDELHGDSRQNFEILSHTNVRIVDLSTAADLDGELETHAQDATWLVDAMLGTGAHGEPRGPFRAAIDWMNRQPAKRLAIDVPSGLNCDTGQAAEHTFEADQTCTFVAAKTGFSTPEAAQYLGQMHLVSIGIPPRLILEVASRRDP